MKITDEIKLYLEGLKKETENKNLKLVEEKSAFITLLSDTNLSTNKNDVIKSNLNFSKNVNDAIFHNYLNSINIGYNGTEDDKNIQIVDDEVLNHYSLECEPIPSFLYCLKKTSNT